MLLFLFFACSDPVQEYTIPNQENNNWEKWDNQQKQEGAKPGQVEGKPPLEGRAIEGQGEPQEALAVGEPPNENAESDKTAPDATPDILSPDGGEVPPIMKPGMGEIEEKRSCQPIPSSEYFTPKKEKVVVSGMVDIPSASQLLIEVVQQDGEKSITQYSLHCDPTKGFEFELQPNMGDVYLAFFQDGDGNGPSEVDKKGVSQKITVETEDITDIKIVMNGSIEPLSFPFEMKRVERQEKRSDIEDTPPVQEALPEGIQGPEENLDEAGDKPQPLKDNQTGEGEGAIRSDEDPNLEKNTEGDKPEPLQEGEKGEGDGGQ